MAGWVTVPSDFAERDGVPPGVCSQKAETDWRNRQPLSYSRKQKGRLQRRPFFFTSHEQAGLWALIAGGADLGARPF
jgi:hypothetical protein